MASDVKMPPMYFLRSNPALTFDASDFGMRVAGAALQAPPEVYQFFRRLGVQGTDLLIPTMDEMPTAFAVKFHLSPSQYAIARRNIAQLLTSEGLDWNTPEPVVLRGFGAAPPPLLLRKP
jgi:hypothetical protein